jgi:hypothetical protein
MNEGIVGLLLLRAPGVREGRGGRVERGQEQSEEVQP